MAEDNCYNPLDEIFRDIQKFYEQKSKSEYRIDHQHFLR